MKKVEKRVIVKKVSRASGSFHAKIRQINEEREKRMHEIEGAVMDSGVIEQLKKVRTNSANSNQNSR